MLVTLCNIPLQGDWIVEYDARMVEHQWTAGHRWSAFLVAERAGVGSHAEWLYWLLVAAEA